MSEFFDFLWISGLIALWPLFAEAWEAARVRLANAAEARRKAREAQVALKSPMGQPAALNSDPRMEQVDLQVTAFKAGLLANPVNRDVLKGAINGLIHLVPALPPDAGIKLNTQKTGA